MARDFNSFSFIGRLVEDEFKTYQGTGDREGYARGRFATNCGNNDKESLFVTVFANESVIGPLYQYVTKGKPFVITGRLSQSSYTAKDGTERTDTVINATAFDFAPGGPRQEGDGPAPARGGTRKPTSAKGNGSLPF